MRYSHILNVLLAVALILLIIKTNEPGNTNAESMNQKNEHAVLNVIHSRKSVRHFTDQKVSEEQLITLVKAGMAAPTARNQQPWAFFIIRDKGVLNQLADTLPFGKMLKQVNSAIIVCGNTNKSLKEVDSNYWTVDCAVASENILIAAEAMGLGAAFTAAFPYPSRMDPVRDHLQLPENFIPLCVIPVGYSAGIDKPKDKWRPENLFFENYGNPYSTILKK